MANRNGWETAYNIAEVTKSDTTQLSGVRGLFVGGAGDVEVVAEGGGQATFTAVAGQIIPVRAVKVMSTGTTATGIVALY